MWGLARSGRWRPVVRDGERPGLLGLRHGHSCGVRQLQAAHVRDERAVTSKQWHTTCALLSPEARLPQPLLFCSLQHRQQSVSQKLQGMALQR